MDVHMQVLDDFSRQIEWWILSSRLGRPAGDGEVAARVHTAILSLLERQRPSDEELDVYRKPCVRCSGIILNFAKVTVLNWSACLRR